MAAFEVLKKPGRPFTLCEPCRREAKRMGRLRHRRKHPEKRAEARRRYRERYGEILRAYERADYFFATAARRGE